MQVSEETRQKWQKMRESGDLRKIEKLSNRSYKSVFNALKDGKGSISLISTIDKFYQKRERELKRINESDNN